MEDCKNSHYEATIDFEDWQKNVKNQRSVVSVRCKKCGISSNVLLRNFHFRKAAKCFCNGSIRWCSKEGHERLLEILDDSRFEPLEELKSLDWWLAQKFHNHSHIPIKCTKCNTVSPACELNRFVLTRTALCSCRFKTQTMVLDFVIDLCRERWPGRFEVKGEVPFAKHIGSLRLDIGISEKNMLVLGIEVDGAQHFRLSTGFKCNHEDIRKRDLSKELYAMQNRIPMIRVFQESVWAGEYNWRQSLSNFIEELANNNLQPMIYREPHKVYQEGAYATMREGSIVDVSIGV